MNWVYIVGQLIINKIDFNNLEHSINYKYVTVMALFQLKLDIWTQMFYFPNNFIKF